MQECIIYAVGKPVFFKSVEHNYGAWMRDPMSNSDMNSEKIWLTKENDPYRLYEYENKAAYRLENSSKIYRLKYPFQVN